MIYDDASNVSIERSDLSAAPRLWRQNQAAAAEGPGTREFAPGRAGLVSPGKGLLAALGLAFRGGFKAFSMVFPSIFASFRRFRRGF